METTLKFRTRMEDFVVDIKIDGEPYVVDYIASKIKEAMKEHKDWQYWKEV